MKWEGQPETWNPSSPAENTNLHVTVTDYSHDAGVAGCLAKALTYYAAGTEKIWYA
ncbi:glycoside hydrolase family 48 protein [Saccharicrinis fermentans]|uniref:Endoglucanase F n=1 Tax=Saccharicrinis fermentans DSM 9555 = JCM 21142 TaxID=869213 RepID=W7YMW2_9BACT|nr:glycoside hydrolase family 48 protein [Saccharicrinis fermentans]GAF06016.1 endoglucanase F precursor [Saccharicrinis fermentans DSM 9555 = JCM 21142]